MNKAQLIGAVLAATAVAPSASAQDEKHFQGPFLGAEAGYMDAGDGINGLYFGLTAGHRTQTDSGYVYGVEGTFGKTDVDIGGVSGLIDNQWSAMATFGQAFGNEKRNLVSFGAGYVKVNVSSHGISTSGDGLSTFIGYERALGNNFSFRARVTAYDDVETVIATGGFSYRF